MMQGISASRLPGLVICALCFLMGMSHSAWGTARPQSAALQQPVTALEAAELVLADAQVMIGDASDPERSINEAVRLVEEAAAAAQTAVQLVESATGTREEIVAAQELRRRARVFSEASRLVYHARYGTRVSNDMESLRARIEQLRPECGPPGFSADWHFSFAEIGRRLEQLGRGDADPVSIRNLIDGHLEALHISVQAHESYSRDLCSLHDARIAAAHERAEEILTGERLREVILDFEGAERRSRAIPGNACRTQGYLRVMPSWTRAGIPGQASVTPQTSWTRHAVAFVRDHVSVIDERLRIGVPEGRLHTRRSDANYSCPANELLITTIEEHVARRGNYAVVLQYGRVGPTAPLHGDSERRPVEMYLSGIRDEILSRAVAEAPTEERAAYDSEYNRRFARLDWIGKRLEQDVRVVRMLAGDVQGDDREAYLTLFAEHSRAYDAREQRAEETRLQLELAREANRGRLEEAKTLATARVETAQIGADALVRAAKEQARASRFVAVVRGVSSIVSRFVPTRSTRLEGRAPN